MKLLFSLFALGCLAAEIPIRHIQFLSSMDEVQSEEMVFVDAALLGYAEALHTLSEPYLGEPLEESTLVHLQEDLNAYFATNPFAQIDLPDQEASSGTVAFVITSSVLDGVNFYGNRWFRNAWLQSALDLEIGKPIDEIALLNRTAWINRNPFIRTNLIFANSSRRKISVDVVSSDRFPLRVFGGVDNTGNDFTGNQRFFTGFTASIGLRNLLTYHFTSGFDFPEFLAHYANWTYFLPWMHELIVYGGYGTVHPKISSFETVGRDIQGSLRYAIPIKPIYTPFKQEVSWGVDFKQTNSDLFFLSSDAVTRTPVNSQNAALFQFYLGYLLQRSWTKHDVTFRAETFFSPFKFLENQSDSHYNSLREGAKPRYFYGRLFLADTYEVYQGIKLAGLLRIQASPSELLPSEQFGLGGHSTVRGYEEREFNADNAICASFEFRSPAWTLFRKIKDELLLLAFIDYGWGYNISQPFPQQRADWLMGIGPAVHYSIFPYLSARFDYGFKMHDTQFGNHHLGRGNFSITVAY